MDLSVIQSDIDSCRLLDVKTQESFYHKIVARYRQLCMNHSKDLDEAFATLSLDDSTSDVFALEEIHPSTVSPTPFPQHRESTTGTPPPSTELSNLLLALRKLREGLLATSSTAPSPVFSQRVHVFNIRLAILARHPPSYHPSLLHLLVALHTPEFPLPRSELAEMTAYLILDMATRQGDLGRAYTLRSNSRTRFDFSNRNVDAILRSLVTNDWVTFWRIYRKVDGYTRAMLHWHLDRQRKMALEAIARSYMTCDIKWIVQSTTGNEMSWEELVAAEDISWLRDGDRAIIRKPKAKRAAG